MIKPLDYSTGKSFKTLLHKLYTAANSDVNTRKLFQTLTNDINILTLFKTKQETEKFLKYSQILRHKTKLCYVFLDNQIKVAKQMNVRNKITLLKTK